MAYNLQPLINILKGILNPDQTRWIVDENNPQLLSLLDKATSLQKLLDNKSSFTKLDSQIREVAHQAEDILESHMVDHMFSGSAHVRFTLSTPDLQQVTRDLDSVIEQAGKPMEMEDQKMLREVDSAAKMPSSSQSSSKRVVVGIDGDLRQLRDRLMLTCKEKKLEIVPIVGMGGIGKTTLARKLYEDPLIAKHFPKRALTTISQGYNMRLILKSLLYCITGNECDQPTGELKVMLFRSLYNTKYLIVLDDIWGTEFWSELWNHFPENNNGSRIVITTRESDAANYASSSSPQHQVQLLDGSESWDLLRQLVFGEEECPLELQEVGRKIAKDCGGLPLAISVIGGLLSKMERSEDVWRKIGDNVIAAISGSDDRCYSILSLSYNHLPSHLKPCFLYMGAFPEDCEIKGSRLVHLLVAEGFVKSNGEKSLEEEAKYWLESLVGRNLVTVREYNKYGTPKSYSMHDVLRDLCIRKFSEDMFLYVKNGSNVIFSNPRRLTFDSPNGIEDVSDSTEFMSLTRSVICIGSRRGGFPSSAFFAPRLLRVLDFMHVWFLDFPTEIFEFVNLRFLGVQCRSRISRGISRLWNLQTLIGDCKFHEPAELWKLSELRNLIVLDFELLKDEKMNYGVLMKLQIISCTTLVKKASTRDGFFESIPNIKNLAIDDGYRTAPKAIDLSHLHKLEILVCRSIRCTTFADGYDRCFNVRFPGNIRKLVLYKCEINTGVLSTLCKLHKLEVLTIRGCMFINEVRACDEVWELAEEDKFCSLQFLSLKDLRLVRWIGDNTNFPRLCHLRLYRCSYLEEIPSSFGDISTLKLIELDGCSKSSEKSAETIRLELSDNGDEDFKLNIRNMS